MADAHRLTNVLNQTTYYGHTSKIKVRGSKSYLIYRISTIRILFQVDVYQHLKGESYNHLH